MRPNRFNPLVYQHFISDPSTRPYVWQVRDMAHIFHVFSRYDYPEPVFDEKRLKTAMNWMHRTFGDVLLHTRSLSHLEAMTYFRDNTTSPGWPYNLTHQTKAILFQDLGHDWLATTWELFLDDPDAFDFVFAMALKPESRKREKDARGLTGAPVDYVYLVNRAHGKVKDNFYDAGASLLTPSAVGMVKEHGGWSLLYHKLAVFQREYHSPCTLALDVKRFDSRLASSIIRAIYAVIACCSHLDSSFWKKICNVVFATYVILPDGTIARKRRGNPSGGPRTADDNTLGLFIILAYTFLECAEHAGVKVDIDDFETLVVPQIYGDDNTFSVHPSIHSWFNSKTITASLLGISVEVEWENDGDFAYVDQCTFLSAGFKEVDGVIVPVYAMDKHINNLLESSRVPSPARFYQQLCAYYLLHAFDEHAERINAALDFAEERFPDEVAPYRPARHTRHQVLALYAPKK
jgi:hypothetical protein